ncbi:hypothetical protein POX_b02370 [Penicillium oxalicum]|uniref:Uncharacterized protein n=1 Tax=Penicillium oxalicum (strain 114-2 / CGMCC 5302) TaxID=933388 RepID=S7ZJY9_PENO1|nr:hypothetical protein POX_b02370 [Penicillium oxalicum]EPS30624.1 hypothetical protein PDE_05576 [Penicillium oxalicum 114-2]KAI2792333.1 hypothetical protein POX_b02370 [Penicillium oxalicum]
MKQSGAKVHTYTPTAHPTHALCLLRARYISQSQRNGKIMRPRHISGHPSRGKNEKQKETPLRMDRNACSAQ